MHILQACKISDEVKKALEQKGYTLIPHDSEYEKENILGILTSTKLKLDDVALKAHPNLKWVARLGSGMELIDQEYCEKNNILCVSSPKGIAQAVAEHVCGMLISWYKNIDKSGREIRQGKWIREANRGIELNQMTLGIIGCGHTGNAVGRLMKHLCKKVIGYDKYVDECENDAIEMCSLQELQSHADIISFHVPLNEETQHYYNTDFISHCRQHLLVNTSRGAVVSNEALLEALNEKQIIGACLDVLEGEEMLSDRTNNHWSYINRLSEFDVILTPHIAGYSHDAIEKMSDELYHQLSNRL